MEKLRATELLLLRPVSFNKNAASGKIQIAYKKGRTSDQCLIRVLSPMDIEIVTGGEHFKDDDLVNIDLYFDPNSPPHPDKK